MKSAIKICLVAFLFFTTSCNKWDDFFESHSPKPETPCELMQSFYSYDGSKESLFRKEIDNTTGKTKKLVVSAYTFFPTDSLALILHYSGNLIYLLMEKNPADTFLVAAFNNNGKLEKLTRSNTTEEPEKYVFPSLQFDYAGQRLSRYIIIGETYITDGETETEPNNPIDIDYDSYGNPVRVHNNTPIEPVEIIYTYDYSVKANRQFYPDGFGLDLGISSLYLAQFMGWLPDLEPVHKRITSKSSAGYLGYDAHLTNHWYDGNKNLLQYTIGQGISFSNVWSCSEK